MCVEGIDRERCRWERQKSGARKKKRELVNFLPVWTEPPDEESQYFGLTPAAPASAILDGKHDIKKHSSSFISIKSSQCKKTHQAQIRLKFHHNKLRSHSASHYIGRSNTCTYPHPEFHLQIQRGCFSKRGNSRQWAQTSEVQTAEFLSDLLFVLGLQLT